jgi:hypothetical protein
MMDRIMLSRACSHIILVGLILGTFFFSLTSRVYGYSVLSHEAIIDTLWGPVIIPLLLKRYPHTTPQMLREAHAYAYGGSVIQDMGYYPFGNRFFSDLTHYVRSGDFIVALLDQARNLDEYAFALGALSHYVADNTGHPLAVNLSVPIMYPKLARKYGRIVTFEDDPQAHIMVEFSFDVAQIAGAGYLPKTYQNFIGFKVAEPLLARAFQSTYGIDFDRLFLCKSLTFAIYRQGASEIIPRITQIAWKKKKKAIRKVNPNLARMRLGYRLSPENYQKVWNRHYRRPEFIFRRWDEADARLSLVARFLVFLIQILPKVGRLQTLEFKPPTPGTQAMFIHSFGITIDRYRDLLAKVNVDGPAFADRDLDTGKPAHAGDYVLADKTYARLLHNLAHQHFAGVSPELRANILSFYQNLNAPVATKKNPKHWRELLKELANLQAYPAQQVAAQRQ